MNRKELMNFKFHKLFFYTLILFIKLTKLSLYSLLIIFIDKHS